MEEQINPNRIRETSRRRYLKFTLAFIAVIVGVFILYVFGSWVARGYGGLETEKEGAAGAVMDSLGELFNGIFKTNGFELVGQISLNDVQEQVMDGAVLQTEGPEQFADSEIKTGKIELGEGTEEASLGNQVSLRNDGEVQDQRGENYNLNAVNKASQSQVGGATTSAIQTEDFKQCAFNTAQTPSREGLIINEVAWMGGAQSSNDEWIELKNISNAVIDLENWQLLDKDEQIKINLGLISKSKVSPGGFILLERTDDSSAPNVAADLIYTGALSNASEGLRLFDSECSLIDEVLADPDWPAGLNSSFDKKTMERDRTGFGWHTSSVAGGTPKRENSEAVVVSGGGGSGNVTANQTQSATSTQETGQSKILISEIQITGGTGKTENDFIELYNPNDTSVNLSGYRLVKRTKTGASDTSIKSWTTDIFIPAKSYYLWANSGYGDIPTTPDAITTATISNDNGIAIRLGPEDTGQIVDSVAWGEAQNSFVEGQAFSPNPGANQSLQRKIQNNNFVDTDNNANDFEVQNCPSPKAQSRSCAQTEQDQASGASLVSDSQNASSTASSTSVTISDNQSSSTSQSSVNHILISEIMAGAGTGHSDEEFIELYNPTAAEIDLTSYSLKRRSSVVSTSTQTLAKAESFQGKIMKPHSFLLIVSPEYQAGVASDLIYSSSYRLAYDDDTLILYGGSEEIIDEIGYLQIDGGQSLERRAVGNDICVPATEDGEFLGNGCDTDNISDFEIRATPNPQNSGSLPEPNST